MNTKYSNLTDKELASLAYQEAKTPLEQELLVRLEKKVYYAVEVNPDGSAYNVQERLFQ